MNIKFVIPIAVGLGMMPCFTSCGGEDNDGNEPMPITNEKTILMPSDLLFVASVPVNDMAKPASWNFYSGTQVRVKYDYNLRVCEIMIEGMRYRPGSDNLSVTMYPIPITADSDERVSAVEAPGPFYIISNGQQHSLTNLTLRTIADDDKSRGEDNLYFSFVIDGTYHVETANYRQYYGGTTSTTGGPYAAYTTSATTYKVTLAPQRGSADIELTLPRFAAEMPQFQKMEFSNLPLTFNAGGYEIKSSSFIPKVMMADQMLPADRFEVTNLICSGEFPQMTGTVNPGIGTPNDQLLPAGTDFLLNFTVGSLGNVAAVCSSQY